MDNYFVKENGTSRDKDKFRDISVCIMDEASQCTEPEVNKKYIYQFKDDNNLRENVGNVIFLVFVSFPYNF